MLGIAREDAFGDGAGFLPQRQCVIAARHDREERQRVERLRFIILWIFRGQRAHRIHVRLVAHGLVARPVERLDRGQIPLLTRRRRFRHTGLGRRAEFCQRRPAGGDVLVKPERLIETHRLAPVGERKLRIDLLRRAKRLDRLFVAEAVKPRDAADKILLRRRCAGIGKRHGAERRTCAARAVRRRHRRRARATRPSRERRDETCGECTKETGGHVGRPFSRLSP